MAEFFGSGNPIYGSLGYPLFGTAGKPLYSSYMSDVPPPPPPPIKPPYHPPDDDPPGPYNPDPDDPYDPHDPHDPVGPDDPYYDPDPDQPGDLGTLLFIAIEIDDDYFRRSVLSQSSGYGRVCLGGDYHGPGPLTPGRSTAFFSCVETPTWPVDSNPGDEVGWRQSNFKWLSSYSVGISASIEVVNSGGGNGYARARVDVRTTRIETVTAYVQIPVFHYTWDNWSTDRDLKSNSNVATVRFSSHGQFAGIYPALQ